jgi:hypothetical protein
MPQAFTALATAIAADRSMPVNLAVVGSSLSNFIGWN